MPFGAEPVVLAGPAMATFVRAVATLSSAGLDRYAVIGGVAVTARLAHTHRATVDVDTVVDETRPPDATEALLAMPGTALDPTGDHRVLIGGTKVEILGVGPIGDDDLDDIPPKNALFVAAHVWPWRQRHR